MARARNIKPGFFANPELVELPFSTRLLFIGLWTVADRSGRLEDRPKKIKMAVFPADEVDVDGGLNDLQNAGFLLRYEVGGERYIQILAFDRHQHPHKDEKASTIPAPCEHHAGTMPTPAEQDGNPADSLLLNPDPLISEKAQAPVARKRAPRFDPREIELPDWLHRAVWVMWCDDRQARKKPITQEGAKLQVAKLDGFRADGFTPKAVIEHCIANGYQGLFAPPKGNSQQQGEPREWHESKSGVERKAIELGVDPHRIDEQWPTFRQRVMRAARAAGSHPPTLDQLAAMAAGRAA